MYNEGVKAYFEKFFYDPIPGIEGYLVEKDEVTLVIGYRNYKGITVGSKMIKKSLDDTIKYLEATGIHGSDIVLSDLRKHRK